MAGSENWGWKSKVYRQNNKEIKTYIRETLKPVKRTQKEPDKPARSKKRGA